VNLITIAKQSSLYLLENVARRAVGFLMLPVYAHYLTPGQYGVMEILELIVGLVVITLGMQAMGGAMVRLFNDEKDEEAGSALVSSTMLSTAAISLAIAGIAYVAAVPMSILLFKTPEYAGLIQLAFIAMVFGNMSEVCLLYYRLGDRVRLVVMFSLLQLVAQVALNTYFIVFAGMAVWGFMWSKLIVAVAGGTILMFDVFRKVRIRWQAESMQKVANFSLPLIATSLSVFTIHFGDRFFLNQMHTLKEVGVYSLAYKVAFLISYLVGDPFARVWGVSLYANAVHASWRTQTEKVGRWLTFLLFLTGLTICLFVSPILVILTDRAFWGAAAVIPILVLGYIAREIGDFFKVILYINKRTYLVARITFLCAAVNTVLNLLLIRTWGIAGAAWATLITWLLYMVCCWTLAEREHQIAFRLSSFAKIGGLATVLFGIARLYPMGEGFWLVVQNTLLILIFCSLLVVAGYLPRGMWGTAWTSFTTARSKTS